MTNKEDTPMNEHNALLKKSRMTRYFIDAVITLSDDIPVDAITLRQVAAAAGSNSATLYNYFQNKNQLIAFTLIDPDEPDLDRRFKVTGATGRFAESLSGAMARPMPRIFPAPSTLFCIFFNWKRKRRFTSGYPTISRSSRDSRTAQPRTLSAD